MKTISLTQPWASLVMIGAKRIETRSWQTRYTGSLAIHASKGFPKWARETAFGEEPFREVLSRHYGSMAPQDLPLGRVLCIVRLMGCRRTEDVRDQLTAQELAFGDYADGRFAWFMEFVELVPSQPEVKGSLGLWEWDAIG